MTLFLDLIKFLCHIISQLNKKGQKKNSVPCQKRLGDGMNWWNCNNVRLRMNSEEWSGSKLWRMTGRRIVADSAT